MLVLQTNALPLGDGTEAQMVTTRPARFLAAPAEPEPRVHVQATILLVVLRLSLLLVASACRFEPGALPGDARGDGGSGTGDGTSASDAMRDALVPGDAPTSFLIEAEMPNFTSTIDTVHNWTIGTALAGYSGTGYVTALPNSGSACGLFDVCGAFSTYDLTIAVAGTYRVTIRHQSPSGGSDSVYWSIGFNPTVTEDLDPDVNSAWVDDTSTSTVTLETGAATFTLRMREFGVRVDSIRLDLE